MSEVPEPVKKCAEMLKITKSDTEKFAALFMVTKLVKGKDCTPAAKKVLFEAIGFEFLKKLLSSKNLPSDCPPLVYKSVALSILTCFCQEQDLATHKDMIEAIPTLLEIVQTADDDDYDDNLIVVSEAYSCLKSIASYEPGQKALLNMGAIPKMSQIYSQQSFQTDEALHLIVLLTSKFGPAAWSEDPKPFHALIQRIALDMETDHSDRKFELCKILSSLLLSCRRDIIVNSLAGEIWPESIFKGANDILRSKIGKEQRDPTLHLTASALQVLGIEWAFMDDAKQFFLLLIQLAAIEVRMQMDDKKLERTFSNADLITCCFIILELSIEYMGNDQVDLDQKEKQSTYTALKGCFNAVLAVITRISNDKIKDNLSPRDKAFVCAIVRILSAWLAQETSAMRPGIYKVLPYMFKVANETFREVKSFRQEKKEGEAPADILRVMLPALCHLAVEDEARKIILSTKQEEVLFEALEFYFSIAHYKKPPIPRAERLKRMNEPDPVPTAKQLEEMKDARAGIVSLCNIFMNLTVLEPKIVEESALFANLLKFIFDNLPELKDIPDNLVMHGHLAVSGLLLLKQQAKKVKKNDFSICRYIQATIRFLWDAYNIDESNDPTALVVSITYKEHWMEISELWFLGMQTMCGILPLIPWISEFAIESGWAEGIIQTLRKVKIGTLPPNVKSAYEDFLSNLVDANENVVPVLKKADALRVCRNHRMMELGKKLFDVLVQQYGVSQDDAVTITTTFLQSFRSCPDNSETTLQSWRSYLWSQALPDHLKQFSTEIYKKWLQLRLKYLAITKDCENLLKRLRNNYYLGLITNGPSNAQWEKVNMLNLRHYFDCILVSADLPWEKPNPNIFWTACNCLNVKPNMCVMIGDKLETDIKGGKDASFGATVWMPLKPEYVVDDVQPVPDIIVENLIEISSYLPTFNTTHNASITRRHSQTPAASSFTPKRFQQYRRVVSLSDIECCSDNSLDCS